MTVHACGNTQTTDGSPTCQACQDAWQTQIIGPVELYKRVNALEAENKWLKLRLMFVHDHLETAVQSANKSERLLDSIRSIIENR